MGAELRAGTELAGYRIESLLGRGAMGAVYLATDLRLERRVALKVLAPELARDTRFRERFLRESRLAASLDHPHIVPVFASGEADGLLFIAMRFVQGRDLHDVVGSVGRLDPERALELLSQVADALDAAHAAGLVHRDVKPGNILVSPGREGAEHAYLCDFGLAKHASTVASLTSERSLVGTIDYIAPEQIEGGLVDGRADIYGLGCVLYECLCGLPPFRRGMELAVVYAHLRDAPPPLSERRPELPVELDEVIACALAKDPAGRYATAGELMRAARAVVAGASHQAPTPPTARPHVRTFMIADVRGYTAYTRAHGDAAAAALAQRFAQLARQAIELHHGELVEVRGDEALAVFDSTRDALQAAVALQRQSRIAGLERGIGIGIDAGEAVPVDEGYRGSALNLAARLCSVCKPGEILASDHAVHLAGPVDGVQARPRRPVRLKGMNAPVSPIEIVPHEPYPAPAGVAVARPRRRRRRRLIAGAAAAVAAIAVAAAFVIRASRPGARPATAVAGVVNVDAVVAIDPRTNRVVARVPLPAGSTPRDIAFAAGAVWVAEIGTSIVSRIDPASHAITPIGLDNVQALVADGSSVWVASRPDPARHGMTLYRIDAASGQLASTRPVPLSWDGSADYSAVTTNDDIAIAGGAVWLPAPGKGLFLDLLRVPIDGSPIAETEPAGAFTGQVAAADGAIWALATTPPQGLTNRVDTIGAAASRPRATTIQNLSQPVDVRSPNAIVAGAGAVWMLGADNRLWKIRPDGTIDDVSPLGDGTWTGLALGAGSLWVADSNAGVIARIDAASGRVVRRIHVGDSAVRIAFGNGLVWISTQATNADAAAAGTQRALRSTLRIVEEDGGPDYWDGTSYWGDAAIIENATCNALLDYPHTRDPARNSLLAPGVAAALPAVSDGGRTYTFTIRRGLRFSNGQPLTPADVKGTFERLLDPTAKFDAAASTHYYDEIDGFREYQKGAHGIRGIVVHGDTVSFHLTRPDVAFLYALAMRWACIVPASSPHVHVRYPPPMTGAYRIASFIPGRSITLLRNPSWPNNARIMRLDQAHLALFDRIVIRFGVDGAHQLQMIERGEADLSLNGAATNGPQFARARANPADAARLIIAAGAQLDYLALNSRVAPFSNLKLRQAANLAIDRTAIARLRPQGSPWSALAPSALMLGHSGDAYPPRGDPAAARSLVAASGVKRPVPLRILYIRGQPNDAVVGTIARNLNAVGFRATPEPVAGPNPFFALTQDPKRSVQADLEGWFADYPDASTFLGPLIRQRGPASANRSHFQDPLVNAEIDRVAAMPIGRARTAAWSALATTIAQRFAPYLVLADVRASILPSARLRTVIANPAAFGGVDLLMLSTAA